jgi:hypothetical protein
MRVMKLGLMRWAGHVACVGEKRNACRVWCRKLKEKVHFEDLVVDRKTILKLVVINRKGKCGLD